MPGVTGPGVRAGPDAEPPPQPSPASGGGSFHGPGWRSAMGVSLKVMNSSPPPRVAEGAFIVGVPRAPGGRVIMKK